MLQSSKPVRWKWPLKRLFFGILLVGAGVATFALGYESWLSWVELGFGIAALGSAFATTMSAYPRWVSHKLIATSEGIRVYERLLRDPTGERDFLIPARVIRSAAVQQLEGGPPRVHIETAFGSIHWVTPDPAPKVSAELNALWSDVEFDDSPGWVQPSSDMPFDVDESSIRWRVRPTFGAVGTFIAQAGIVVAIVPLWGVWFGVPFALISAVILFAMSRVVRRWREPFGISKAFYIDGNTVRFDAPPTHRQVSIEEFETVALSVAAVGKLWIAEVNNAAVRRSMEDIGAEKGFIRYFIRMMTSLSEMAWFVVMPQHGIREIIGLIEEMNRLVQNASSPPD